MDRLSADDHARVDAAHRDAHAENTRRTYAAQWAAFEAWCVDRGLSALPAAPDVVAAFLTDRGRTRRIATVRLGAAAIRAAHRAAGEADPTAAPRVALTLRGIARQHAANPDAAPRQARPLTYDEAVSLLTLARQPERGGSTTRAATRRGLLDAVIVALLFCAGMRRSEAASLRWADVVAAPQPDRLRIRVRQSKTNQAGDELDYRLLVNGFAGAVEALRAAGDGEPDPAARVVPLSPRQIARRLAALGEKADIKGLSGHSGRVGMAVELVRRGASTTSVQQAGGWKDPAMVARYARSVQAEDGAVARFFAGGGA